MTKRAPLSFSVDKIAPSATREQTALPEKAQTRKQEKAEKKTGRDGRQFIAGHVNPAAAKQFKILAVQQERTTQDLMVEAINDLFAKYNLSRIA
jgi:hypothetical protein